MKIIGVLACDKTCLTRMSNLADKVSGQCLFKVFALKTTRDIYL